jgi:hypothetical protein
MISNAATMRLVSESGRKPPTVLLRPTASGHVNSVGQGDRPKRSGLKLGSCYFQNAREPDHDIISIATQAGAFVLFIHWRAEPSGAPHPARALGRAGGRRASDDRRRYTGHDRTVTERRRPLSAKAGDRSDVSRLRRSLRRSHREFVRERVIAQLLATFFSCLPFGRQKHRRTKLFTRWL